MSLYIHRIYAIQKIFILDGDKGYMVAQGQRKDLSKSEITKIKKESSPFPELDYLNGDISLEGTEDVNGKKVYKIKLSEEKSSFYDIETGLKIKDITIQKIQGREINSSITYSDYKEVAGIKIPFTISQVVGPQIFNFIVKEIKINEGVSDADFE